MKRLIITFICCMLATFSNAETYGSFVHFNNLPNVLFLTGKIESGDSFELRRALRSHQIDLVVTNSPGGNVYAGLQIASIINDKNLSTYIPYGATCVSACSMVFFGGVRRVVRGDLGVHQFYSVGETSSSSERKDITTAQTQYTTGEIIGIMNEFNTPPFVYEKMLSTIDMYYFTPAEKQRLEIGSDDWVIKALVNDTNSKIKSNPSILSSSENNYQTAKQSAPKQTPKKQVSKPNITKQNETFEGIDFFGSDIYPKGIRGISLFECKNFCKSNSNCAAWTYVKATRWCWPKTGVSNVSLADNVVSGVVNFDLVDQTIFDRPFLEASAVDIPGQDFYPNGLRGLSLDQCRNACLSTNGCVAWSYLPKKSACFPKYGTKNSAARIGVISGVLSNFD